MHHPTKPAAAIMPEQRIPSLDGLRAISIALVVFGHLCGTRNFWRGEPIGFLGLGEFGVRVFFVISGLLITQLLLKEIDKTGGISLGKFYFRRTFRIFPAYYFFLLVLALLQPLGWFLLNQGDLWHALTYTSNYNFERSWNVAHTWSLAVEEQFYLLWPAALLLLGVRRGFYLAVVVCLLAPWVRLGIYQLLPAYAEGIGHQFETVADSIATGCLLALQREWPTTLQTWFQRLLDSRLMPLLPLLALMGNALREHPRPSFLVGHTLANVCIAACVAWAVSHRQGLVIRLLNSRPFIWIGMLSYSIYLWQQIFLNRHLDAWYTAFPANLLLAAGAALLSYYLIEKPSLNLRQWLEAKWFGKSAAQPAGELGNVLAQLATREKVLPFEGGTPSVQAQRALRLDALHSTETRDESPTETFVPALERLVRRKEQSTLTDALHRVGVSAKAES